MVSCPDLGQVSWTLGLHQLLHVVAPGEGDVPLSEKFPFVEDRFQRGIWLRPVGPMSVPVLEGHLGGAPAHRALNSLLLLVPGLGLVSLHLILIVEPSEVVCFLSGL